MSGPYLKVQTRRGGGKTAFALTWAKAQALAGAKHFLIADWPKRAAEEFRDELRRRDHELFLRIKLQAARPQRDEFTLHGSCYDVAIAENIDLWPVVGVYPYSILFDEILAYTHGPVLFTYTDPEAPLVQQIPSPT